MTKLLELADRVEVLTGPDREVDGAICLALGWTLQKMKGDSKPYYREPGVVHFYQRTEPLAYTASLDAAMTLVPEGMWAEGSLASPAALEIHAPMTFDPIGRGWAATPALALCAAALRARHAVAPYPPTDPGRGEAWAPL